MPDSERRPNILVIHCHDLGRHLGCYGRGVETPHIDGLAAEGVRFDQYFSTAPFCAPSRCSRMTGLYPVHHGAMGQTHLGWRMHDGLKALPVYMNELGYDTHLFGFQHESIDPDVLGYQHTENGFPKAPISAMDVAPRLNEFLDERRPEDGPFYADVGFAEVHSVMPRGGLDAVPDHVRVTRFRARYVHHQEAPKFHGEVIRPVDHPCDPYFRQYDPAEMQALPYLPDRPAYRADIADLNALVTCVVDVMVGRVLDKLRETGLDENTLVIFTSDHGIDMPRAKGTLLDAGIEVALIMRLPGRFGAGEERDALLSNVDLMPTLVELAGGEAPEDIDGRSFLPLLTGGNYQTRECIHAENTWHGGYAPMRTIRTERYKFIRNFDVHHHGHYPKVHFKSIDELYDLDADPHEQTNLAPSTMMFALHGEGLTELARRDEGDPAYADVVKDFRRQLLRHMEDTDDPLLAGPVPHPGYQHLWDDV